MAVNTALLVKSVRWYTVMAMSFFWGLFSIAMLGYAIISNSKQLIYFAIASIAINLIMMIISMFSVPRYSQLVTEDSP